MLALDDLVRCVFHFIGDALFGNLMIEVTPHLAEVLQGNASHICARPYRKLRIPVLTDHIRLDIARVNAQMSSESLLQTSGVEHGTRPDDAALGQNRTS